MSNLLEKNPKFNAHTFDDLVRLGNMGDKEATLELGLRFLINDEDFIHPDDCPDCECDTTTVCPDCDCEFDI